MKKSIPALLVLIVLYAVFHHFGLDTSLLDGLAGVEGGGAPTATRDDPAAGHASGQAPAAPAASDTDRILADAFRERTSDLQVEGRGTVSRILPDDVEGSAHQRFILELGTGQTLLVAHNIDLAPRIPSLEVGDEVRFFGEYEWSEQGGVMHWTHHDPKGWHVGGWLEHEGRRYE